MKNKWKVCHFNLRREILRYGSYGLPQNTCDHSNENCNYI